MGNLRGLGFLPNATVSSPEIAALKGLLRDDGGIPIIYKAVFPGKVALGGVPLDTTAKNTFNFPAFRPVFQPIPSFARWSYGRSNCGIQRLKRCNWTPWCLGVVTAGVFMKGTVKDWWGELVNKKFQAGLKHLEYRFALYWSFLLGEIEREREIKDRISLKDPTQIVLMEHVFVCPSYHSSDDIMARGGMLKIMFKSR